MANVFISHSSGDRPFARRVRDDLQRFGHKPWIDDDDIAVGDHIIGSIEQGISAADYVVVILSPRSVASHWVEVEWKAKYWQQVKQNRKMVLPVLQEMCEIPILLQPYKYADCSSDYGDGFRTLLSVLNPSEHSASQATVTTNTDDLYPILARAQVPGERVSQLLVETLAHARRVGSGSPSLISVAEK